MASERILWALSARTTMSWIDFKEACNFAFGLDRLSVDSSKDQRHETDRLLPSRVLRGLTSLGHCDFTFDDTSGEVMVAPPVFVKIPSHDNSVAVLAGQRFPDTIDHLGDLAQNIGCDFRIERFPQQNRLLPDCVRITVKDENSMAELAHAAGFIFSRIPVSTLIMNAVLDLDTYLQTCQVATPRSHSAEQFDVMTLQFTMPKIGDDRSLPVLQRTHLRTGRYRHALYLSSEKGLFVDREYGVYGLLQEIGHHVLNYDVMAHTLYVPVGTPLPILIERAITLTSGKAGHYCASSIGATRGKYIAYGDVPPLQANLISQKLSQPMNHVSF